VNFLPGLSVIEKINAADCVVWMDEMEYVRHGFVNRNVLANGTRMIVPVSEHDTYAPINRVKISDPTFRARKKIAKTLELRLGATAAPYVKHLLRPYQLLVGLNMALLAELIVDLDVQCEHHLQSHLGAGRYEATSVGLAEMVEELGGNVWLSGPSGRNYLDEQPFAERGIEVRYFDWNGESNHSAIELVRERLKVAA
jgi:hypothetical protein